MTPHSIVLFAYGLATMRVVIGLAPFVAAGPLSRLLGFPRAEDNATARLMARLFGVRDAGLGVLVAYCATDAHALRLAALFNLCMDAGDILSAAIPLVRRQGIARGALSTAAFAFVGLSFWVVLVSLLGW